MIMASNLQGCGEAGDGTFPLTWSSTMATVVIPFLLALVVRLFLKLTTKMKELEKYKAVCKAVREAAHLRTEEDPLCKDLECKSVHEAGEEECNGMDEDETLSEGEMTGHNSTSTRPIHEDGNDEEVTLVRR